MEEIVDPIYGKVLKTSPTDEQAASCAKRHKEFFDACDVTFRDGNVAWVHEFRIRYIWLGMLEGFPNEKASLRMIKNIQRTFRTDPVYYPGPFYIINPEERREFLGHLFESGEPAIFPCLPHVGIFANLKGKPTSEEGTGSRLNLIWFQDSVPVDITAELRKRAQNLDWCSVAKAFEH